MHRRPPDQRGTGLIATMMAVPLVLALILTATQVLLRLHAQSTVSSLAQAAARDAGLRLASTPGTTASACRDLREDLGPIGPDAVLDWTVGPDRVGLRVRVRAPRLPMVGALDVLSRPIDVVRWAPVERWR